MISGRLHDICSSFVFEVGFTWIRIGVVEDDVVVWTCDVLVFLRFKFLDDHQIVVVFPHVNTIESSTFAIDRPFVSPCLIE